MQRFETAVRVTMYRCPPWPTAKKGFKHCAYGVPGGWQHAPEHASALALLWQFDLSGRRMTLHHPQIRTVRKAA